MDIFVLLKALAASGVLGALCYMADRAKVPWEHVDGEVLCKEESENPLPSQTGESNALDFGKRTMVKTWRVLVFVPKYGTEHTVEVNEEQYRLLNEGDQVDLEVRTGRFTSFPGIRLPASSSSQSARA